MNFLAERSYEKRTIKVYSSTAQEYSFPEDATLETADVGVAAGMLLSDERVDEVFIDDAGQEYRFAKK